MPIHTKGDRLYPDNYRPISLTSITCKMLEHIVTHSIMLHLENNHILNDDQHGFRKHRSCEAQLIKVVNDLAHNIEHKIQTDVILLDFQKAFDKVPHLRLLYKINYYGLFSPASMDHRLFDQPHSTSYTRKHHINDSPRTVGCAPGQCFWPTLVSTLH